MRNTLLVSTALSLGCAATLALAPQEVRAEACLLDTNEDGNADSNIDTTGGAISDDGNNELACRVGSDASGASSTAIGGSSVASGANTLAAGFGANSAGDNSTAIGVDADATDISATALGYQSVAGGADATAIGRSA